MSYYNPQFHSPLERIYYSGIIDYTTLSVSGGPTFFTTEADEGNFYFKEIVLRVKSVSGVSGIPSIRIGTESVRNCVCADSSISSGLANNQTYKLTLSNSGATSPATGFYTAPPNTKIVINNASGASATIFLVELIARGFYLGSS